MTCSKCPTLNPLNRYMEKIRNVKIEFYENQKGAMFINIKTLLQFQEN